MAKQLHWLIEGFDAKGNVVLHHENVQTILDDQTLGEALDMITEDIPYPPDCVRLKLDIAI